MFDPAGRDFLILGGLGDGCIKLLTQGLGIRTFSKPSTQISRSLLQSSGLLSHFRNYFDPLSDLLHGQRL